MSKNEDKKKKEKIRGIQAPPLLIFRPNWGPKGWKKFFWRLPPPPLSKGLDDRAPPYLKVWIGTDVCFNVTLFSLLHGGPNVVELFKAGLR